MVDTATSLIDALPGVSMPVSEVMKTLSQMWSTELEGRKLPPSEFRASQMNLVLHFGTMTSPEEARGLFDTAISFAQRYPCRIIVLCPMGHERSERLLEGKLFCQCYIGSDLRSMCCCEALMVGYPTREAGFLANQVSVWLEPDLPVYHWFHRVPAERVENVHLDFVQRCRRVVYDSAIEGDNLASVAWPKAEAVVDIAWARLLPVRQTLGQSLSSHSAGELTRGLQGVSVRFTEPVAAEARHLLAWCRRCLQECASLAGATLTAQFREEPSEGQNCLELAWRYDDHRHVLFALSQADRAGGNITVDLGRGRVSYPLNTALLLGDRALSEALFFAQ